MSYEEMRENLFPLVRERLLVRSPPIKTNCRYSFGRCLKGNVTRWILNKGKMVKYYCGARRSNEICKDCCW